MLAHFARIHPAFNDRGACRRSGGLRRNGVRPGFFALSFFQRPIERKNPVTKPAISYTTTEQFLLGDSDVTDEGMLETVLSVQDDEL